MSQSWHRSVETSVFCLTDYCWLQFRYLYLYFFFVSYKVFCFFFNQRQQKWSQTKGKVRDGAVLLKVCISRLKEGQTDVTWQRVCVCVFKCSVHSVSRQSQNFLDICSAPLSLRTLRRSLSPRTFTTGRSITPTWVEKKQQWVSVDPWLWERSGTEGSSTVQRRPLICWVASVQKRIVNAALLFSSSSFFLLSARAHRRSTVAPPSDHTWPPAYYGSVQSPNSGIVQVLHSMVRKHAYKERE